MSPDRAGDYKICRREPRLAIRSLALCRVVVHEWGADTSLAARSEFLFSLKPAVGRGRWYESDQTPTATGWADGASREESAISSRKTRT